MGFPIMTWTVRDIIKMTLTAGLLLFGAACSTNENAEAQIFGPGVSAHGSIFYFWGTVDSSLTAQCGTATVPTSTTDGTSSNTSGTEAKDSTKFNIVSTYTFTDTLLSQGQQMILRYTYNSTQTKFTLSSANTSSQTCTTSNGITCSSSGTLTCSTADNVNCGGSSAFIFSSRNPSVTFNASTGTIDWTKGLVLTDDNSAVASAILSFDMISSDGTAFQGEVTCISDDQ